MSARSKNQALAQAEKMAVAGRLSASIAHEINNPQTRNCLHLAARKTCLRQAHRAFRPGQAEVERLSAVSACWTYRPGASKLEKVILGPAEYILNLTRKRLNERGISVSAEMRRASAGFG
jgi:hypothetical protein